MTDTVANAAWDVLKEFGFTADASVMSDLRPGLSNDFGNTKLSASAVVGKYFQPVILFTGWLQTPRTLVELSFEIPREINPRELVAAFIVWNLDRVAPGRRFTPEREVAWLELGRQHQHLLPWEIAQAKRAEELAAYAARPHCLVNRSVLRLALKSLAAIFPVASSVDSVVVSFDGRVLSFVCNEIESALVAAGTAWSCRYQLPIAAIADALPIRLSKENVEVGIWKSRLEIDRARCPGVVELK